MDQHSARRIEDVFEALDREVWVITSAGEQSSGGLLATWVVQGSIDPERPTLLIGLTPNHFTTQLILQSGVFGAHLLAADQAATALSFAIGSGRDRDKLSGLDVRHERPGPPLLGDCLAYLDCRVYARLSTGDRIYFWADVREGGRIAHGPPLCEKRLVAAATEEQTRALRENLIEDVQCLVRLQDDWRGSRHGELEFCG